jgi:hypothetical protein
LGSFPVPGQEFCPEQPNTLYGGHLRRLERLLYAFAVVNPSLGYMQGFNELVSVLYGVFFAGRAFLADERAPEALAYRGLGRLLEHAPLAALYNTEGPDPWDEISRRMGQLNEVMRVHVRKVWEVTERHSIDPMRFAYGRIMLLFTQEYELPQVREIWDALLARFDHMVGFAFYVAAAQIDVIKRGCSWKTTVEVLQTLQHVTARDVSDVLTRAKAWWREDTNPTQMEIVSRTVQGKVLDFMYSLRRPSL